MYLSKRVLDDNQIGALPLLTVINPFNAKFVQMDAIFFINEGEVNTPTIESNLILRSIVLRASVAVSRAFSRRGGLWGQV